MPIILLRSGIVNAEKVGIGRSVSCSVLLMRRRPWAAQAVAQFMAAAIKEAGSQVKLYQRMEQEGIAPANPKSVSDWARRGSAPGSTLFEIARLTQVSLDEYALDSSLAERLKELEELVLNVAAHVGYHLPDRVEVVRSQ